MFLAVHIFSPSLLSTGLATRSNELPVVVWQGVGGVVGVLLIFGLLVFIVQRVVILRRRPDSDDVSPPGE